MQDRQEAGLDELGFGNWSCNSEQGFAGKEDRAFGQSPNIAGEVEPLEKIEEARLHVSKYRQTADERDFFGGEVNVFKEVETLFETRSDEIVAIERQMTNKELESGADVEPILDIPCRHREFIEVGEEPGEKVAREHSPVYTGSQAHIAVTCVTDLPGAVLSVFVCSANVEFFVYADDLPQSALT